MYKERPKVYIIIYVPCTIEPCTGVREIVSYLDGTGELPCLQDDFCIHNLHEIVIVKRSPDELRQTLPTPNFHATFSLEEHTLQNMQIIMKTM